MTGVLRSEKGSVVLLFVIFFPVFLLAVSMAWDIGNLYTAKITARQALIMATRAASAELDLEALIDPESPHVAIEPSYARSSFDDVLFTNFNRYINALFADNPEVKFFYVVNEPQDAERLETLSVPYIYWTGNPSEGGKELILDFPAVAAKVKVPVELSPFGALAAGKKTVDIEVHTAVAPGMRP